MSTARPTPASPSSSGLDTARLLVQKVARAFYGSRGAILVDQLVQKEAYRDEELGKRLGMPSRDVTKIAHRLVEDQLVSVHRRSEMREGAPKASLRTYFYMDFSKATDVIKWRMWKVQQTIDVKLRNELDAQGYLCPLCKASYTPLDAASLYDPTRNLLACSICHSEVTNNENDEQVKGNKDRMQRLNRQTKGIVDLLKKLEKVELPRFDVEQYLAIHGPALGATAAAAAAAAGTGVTVAPAVKVHLAGDDDEVLEKAKRERELQEKRAQNLLPSWISKSTIETNPGAGDANGEAQNGEAGDIAHGETLNGGTDRADPESGSGAGLGSSGVGVVDIGGFGAAMAFHDATASADAGDQDASAGHDADLDAYYASLEAANDPYPPGATAASTPSVDSPSLALLAASQAGLDGDGDGASSLNSPAVSVGGASGSDGDRGTGEFDGPDRPGVEDENGSGKRSRDEDAFDGRAESDAKKVRLESAHDIGESGSGAVEGEAGDDGEGEEDEFDEVEGEEEGDTDPNQLVSVNGKMMPYCDVTEDMTGEMTADEYSAYWDVYQRLNA